MGAGHCCLPGEHESLDESHQEEEEEDHSPSSQDLLPAVGSHTPSPVRLRMVSSDLLCKRSMQVDWDDGTGVAQSWSSWTEDEAPTASWYEAEKLLPAGATDIKVKFSVPGINCQKFVCMVDRHKDCSWIKVGEQHLPECITLRGNAAAAVDEVDAVFELRGGLQVCYVFRAWNAAREPGLPPEQWEHWADEASRPVQEPRCRTLEAADGAAPYFANFGNKRIACVCATKRVCAALQALMEVHRSTLDGLRELDASFTNQWVGVNVGNTASAGLGIASAVMLFAAPPVGIGLGIGSAVAGSATLAGDKLADWAHLTALRRQLSQDALNCFVVAELIKEWMQARQALASSGAEGGRRGGGRRRPGLELEDLGDTCRSHRFGIGDAVDGGLNASSAASNVAGAGASVADQLGKFSGITIVAPQVLGVAGALISTGYMIRGWSTSKAGQTMCREKMAELAARLQLAQQLLASLDRLECPLCADEVILADTVRRCRRKQHCFHAPCVRHWHGPLVEGASPSTKPAAACPECGSTLGPEVEMLPM